MKTISQMTREEKLQAILDFNPCKVERETVLRYLLSVTIPADRQFTELLSDCITVVSLNWLIRKGC